MSAAAKLLERCLAFGEAFRGRLDDAILDDALEYLEFNEGVLALDVLAAHLYENEIQLQSSEVAELQRLLGAFGDGDPARVRFLWELVQLGGVDGTQAD